MGIKACIYENASKLGKVDEAALLKSYEEFIEAGQTEQQAFISAMVQMARSIETDRSTLLSELQSQHQIAVPARTASFSDTTVEDTVVAAPVRTFAQSLLQNGLGTLNPQKFVENTISAFLQAKTDTKKTNVLINNPNFFSRFVAGDKPADLSELTDKQVAGLHKLEKFVKVFAERLAEMDLFIHKDTIFDGDLNYEYHGTPSEVKAKNAEIDKYNKDLRARWRKDPSIELNFKRKVANSHGNPVGYFVQEDADGNKSYNENFTSAMAVVIANWIGTQGRNTLFNDSEAIRSILGLTEQDSIPLNAFTHLTTAGDVRTSVAEQLGAQIFNLTGLEGKPGIDGDMVDRMKMALGETALGVAMDLGVVEQTAISGEIMADLVGDNFDGDLQASTNFVKISSKQGDERLEPAPRSKRVIDIVESGEKVIQELFDVASFEKTVSFTPIKAVTNVVKNTFQRVSKKQQKVLKKMQAVEYTMLEDELALFNFLDHNALKDVLGYERDIDSLHVTERDKARGTNLAIDREVDNVGKFTDTLEKPDTGFFFNWEVWKNLRMGLVSTTINPQASKVHRFLVGAKNWKSTIKPTDTIKLTYFKVAVAQAFGKDIDKQTLEESTQQFEELLQDPAIIAALDGLEVALHGSTDGGVENAEVQAQLDIIAAVKGSGTDIHSLAGLIALNNYRTAAPNGELTQEFETNISLETDGITNGVIIGLLQSMLETEAAAMLQSGGLFADGGKTASYGEWVDGVTNVDLYQRLSLNWAERFNNMTMDPQDKEFIRSVTGDLVEDFEGQTVVTDLGRKLAKTPLMISNYGATIKKIVNQLAEDSISKFYSQVMAAEDQAALDELFSKLSHFMLQPVTAPKFADRKDYLLPRNIRAGIKTNVVDSMGLALEASLKSQFSGFSEYRDGLNNSFKLMFTVFKQEYDAQVGAALEAKGKPLTAKEKEKIATDLRHLLPMIPTALSDNLAEQLVVLKTEKTRDHSNPAHTVQVAFNRAIKGVVTAAGKASKSLKGTISQRDYAEGGVSGGVLSTQAIDAAIMVQVMENYDSLNIHDATLSGLDTVVDATREYSAAFLEINQKYSVMASTLTALKRVLAEHNKLHPGDVTNLAKRAGLVDSEGEPMNTKEFLKNLEETAAQVKANREAYFAQDVMSNQASLPGAEYRAFNYEETKEKEIEDLFDQAISDAVDAAVAEMMTPLGSSGASFEFETFQAAYETSVTADNSLRIFDQVENDYPGNVKDSAEQTKHLKKVLTDLVNKVLRTADSKPVTLGINNQGDEVLGQISEGIIQIQAGRGQVLQNTSQLSTQETMVHELVHHVTQYALEHNFTLRTQIEKLRAIVAKQVTIEDLMPKHTAVSKEADYEAAKRRHEYIFSGKDSLHEFVAFGITNGIFRAKLATLSATPSRDLTSGTMFERLMEFFNKILDWVQGKIFGTDNLMADAALDKLVGQLVDTNHRYHESLKKKHGFVDRINTATIAQLNKVIYSPLERYYKRVKGPKMNPVQSLVALPFVLRRKVGGQTFRKAIKQVLRALDVTERSFMVKLAREIQGITADNSKWHQLLRMSKHYIDQERRHIAEQVSKDVLAQYGQPLTEEEADALNQALLMTDISALSGQYDLLDLIKFLKSEKALKKEMANISQQLRAYGENGNYYIRQARGMGNLMATGTTNEDRQMRNAHIVAQMPHMDQKPTGDLKKAEQLIDILATLSAINHTDKEISSRAANVINREYMRDPLANGVQYTLETHLDFKEESLARLFHGNKMQTVKGYTTQVYNPNVDVTIGLRADEDKMKNLGFKRIADLEKDRKDMRGRPMAMYVNKFAAQNTYLKSIVSLTNKTAEGTDIMDALRATGSRASNVERIIAMQSIGSKENTAVKNQFKTSQPAQPDRKDKKLVPVVDEQGNITSYRYMMTEAVKHEILEKSNKFDIILGKMSASIHDKVKSKEVNRTALETAYNDYKTNGRKDAAKFVTIGPKASTQRYKEIYAMMPKDMKADMIDIWGSNNIQVREELIDLIFGYRKLSIADMKIPYSRNKDGESLKVFEQIDKVIPGTTQGVKVAERALLELVSIAKDNIVIKSGVVLVDNVLSNNVILAVKGVSPRDISKDSIIAYRALSQYQEVYNQRATLQHKLKVTKNLSTVAKRNLNRQIATLTDTLENNPVKELIDEGIFQSIVEDIDLHNDDYSFRGKAQALFHNTSKKLTPKDSKVSKALEGATEVYKQAYMTKDTASYQILMRLTQKSDFVARFVLYQHQLRKLEKRNKKKALTPEEWTLGRQKALLEVIETFVNYDVPTSPEIQYLNDIGVIMFTKFLFRIQKVILRMFTENPASTMALFSLEHTVGDLASIDDSFLPWSDLMSKFNLPVTGVWDSAAQISALELIDQ